MNPKNIFWMFMFIVSMLNNEQMYLCNSHVGILTSIAISSVFTLSVEVRVEAQHKHSVIAKLAFRAGSLFLPFS